MSRVPIRVRVREQVPKVRVRVLQNVLEYSESTESYISGRD